MPERNRLHYLYLILLTIGIGLFSRTKYIPGFIYAYLGDALYALMMFFIIGFLFQSMTTIRIAIVSLLICYFIEISQLYQATWINELRYTTLGGLVLGNGFLYSDLVTYVVGVLMGVAIETADQKI